MRKILLLGLSAILSMTMFAANVNYNVFVRLDDNAEKVVKEISKELKKVGIDSLYSEGYVVHNTLYLTEYKAENLPQVKEVVDSLAKEAKPIEIEFYRLRKTGGNWLMLDAKNTIELQQLADLATIRLNKYRAMDAEVPGWAKNIPAKAKSFQEFGSPNVFMNFDPHITLLTPKDSDKIDMFLSNYTLTPIKSKIKSIGVAEVDGLGQAQAKNVLYEVEVK